MTPQAPSRRVLIVEDEADLAALVAYQLTKAGFRVETASNGADALRAVRKDAPDLVVLDRLLPGLSGDEVLSRLRGDVTTSLVPVLLLTARREEEDRIEGLELGADDYLTKPFSPKELILRANAILRRTALASEGQRTISIGPLTLDLLAMSVFVDEEEIILTPTEFRLFQALMERPGHTQSRRQLLERAWNVEATVSGRIHTRTVDMHVRRLRGKLGPIGDWIETARGFGYRFRAPEGPA